MIINSVSYEITWPIQTDWTMRVDRERLSTGSFVIYDYGIASDSIIAPITIKGNYDDIKSLDVLLSSTSSITIESEGEQIWGSHVKYDSIVFNAVASDQRPMVRLNTNFYAISLNVSISDPLLDNTVTAGIGGLLYPSTHTGGTERFDEVVNTDSYGNRFVSNRGELGLHSISFDLDKSICASALKYFTNVVRGDGFTLPLDWQSIRPFAELSYTHALILGLSFSQLSLNEYRITLNLQAYNNA